MFADVSKSCLFIAAVQACGDQRIHLCERNMFVCEGTVKMVSFWFSLKTNQQGAPQKRQTHSMLQVMVPVFVSVCASVCVPMCSDSLFCVWCLWTCVVLIMLLCVSSACVRACLHAEVPACLCVCGCACA